VSKIVVIEHLTLDGVSTVYCRGQGGPTKTAVMASSMAAGR
jgi:hypothetical protein